MTGQPGPPASVQSPKVSTKGEMKAGHPKTELGDWTLFRQLGRCVWPYRGQLGLALLLVPTSSFLEVAQPYLFKSAIDDNIAAGTVDGLATLGGLYFLTLLGQYGTAFAQTHLLQGAGQKAMADLRRRLFAHLGNLPLAHFDRTPVGVTMTRLTSDIESLSEMFANGFVALLADVLKIAFVLVALFTMDTRLAWFCLLCGPLLGGLVYLFRRVVRQAFRQVRAVMAELNGFLQEHFDGFATLRAFTLESRATATFGHLNTCYREATQKSIAADASLYAIVEALSSIILALLLWLASPRVADNTLSVGVLVAFFSTFKCCSHPFGTCQRNSQPCNRRWPLENESSRCWRTQRQMRLCGTPHVGRRQRPHHQLCGRQRLLQFTTPIKTMCPRRRTFDLMTLTSATGPTVLSSKG